MRQQVIAWDGTGVARDITTLAFQPDVLLIKGGSNVAVIRTSTMPTDSAKNAIGNTAIATGVITAILPNGFSLGTDARVNANGTRYRCLALKASAGNVRSGHTPETAQITGRLPVG